MEIQRAILDIFDTMDFTRASGPDADCSKVKIIKKRNILSFPDNRITVLLVCVIRTKIIFSVVFLACNFSL